MPTAGPITLTEFLAEARDDVAAVILDVAQACQAIAHRLRFGTLAGLPGEPRAAFTGLPTPQSRGSAQLLFEALDGASDLDVNAAVGSIFAVLHASTPDVDPQGGDEQLAAGYAIYGPATMLVLTIGRGTHGFTLQPVRGDWLLSHPGLRIPTATRQFAVQASNARFWEPAVQRYVDECLAGQTGPRGSDFQMRWIASLVAETHRILLRGGVFLQPRDTRAPAGPGRLRLRAEARPVALLIEQAGGLVSTGRHRLLDAPPEALQEQAGLFFGAADEVARIQTYHLEPAPDDRYDAPLFGHRGLFATTTL